MPQGAISKIAQHNGLQYPSAGVMYWGKHCYDGFNAWKKKFDKPQTVWSDHKRRVVSLIGE